MTILVDLDGTLADPRHRMHLLPRERPAPEEAWDRFMAPELVAQDGAHEHVWRTVYGLAAQSSLIVPLVIMTARREALRETTRRWLQSWGGQFGMECWIDNWVPMLMRPPGDRRPSSEVKRDNLAKLRDRGFRPTVAFDDRPEDCAMYREAGLFVFHVDHGAGDF